MAGIPTASTSTSLTSGGMDAMVSGETNPKEWVLGKPSAEKNRLHDLTLGECSATSNRSAALSTLLVEKEIISDEVFAEGYCFSWLSHTVLISGRWFHTVARYGLDL